jgi:hypothetical protein
MFLNDDSFGKPSEFHIAEVSISWRRWAHDSACITGSHGVNNVVDAGIEMVYKDSVAMYLGYDVCVSRCVRG